MAFALLGEEEEAYEELQNEVPNLIVEELEKIKAEIDTLYSVYDSHFTERVVIKSDVMCILDQHISELKGEQTMKLIVDIDEKTYKDIKQFYDNMSEYECIGKYELAIAEGIPLENIKADIEEEKAYAYADFERYKVDYLGQDWEDVYDSLPQDDFRYGMRRALEIINKHIKGNKQ